MIKKIFDKIKRYYRAKKTVSKPEIKSKTESKTSTRVRKPATNDKSAGSGSAPVQRKKETPEEYRLRREKRSKNKAKTATPTLEKKSEAEVKITEPWNESEFKVPVADGKIRFHDLEMSKEILHAIFDLGFQYCTPVQGEVLPKSLLGEDITAQAQTGTGKTAAFLITIFNHILKNPLDKKRKHGTPRALILAPTRELVLQIEKDARGIGPYVDCSILSLLGGMDYEKQMKILKSENCDILICTPGRLIDFMRKKLVDLSKVEILIIDEADRMLDMGFIPSVKQIVNNTPSKSKRQTMFFSATLTGDVKRLAESWTRQAFEVTVKPDDVAVQSVEQITYITTITEKPTLLYNLIMQKNLERVLVFVNRRHHARKLKETFEMYGISCALLSGEVDQSQRIKRLEKFREGKIRVLVATDVASRGIHVEAISHVINYNMPQDVEEYVHRIGRTGRAGASGISINFADEEDSYEIQKVEEFLGKKIECIFPEEELLIPIPEIHRKKVIHKPPQKNVRRDRKGPRRK
ncbi:MAG: ATP-dependent RNA helicase RhlB [Ignavibacteriae bacterium HGW-Ignavibacteriae-3]|nr:MAG: ATP-dependent RNA helicase RhlB [Ignavibacteriae bacterium HGW-Ignavibacteriae-3]